MGKALYLALIAAAIALAQTLPLVEVRDWSDRPLPDVTVVVFSPDGKVLAAVKTDQQGRIPATCPRGLSKWRGETAGNSTNGHVAPNT